VRKFREQICILPKKMSIFSQHQQSDVEKKYSFWEYFEKNTDFFLKFSHDFFPSVDSATSVVTVNIKYTVGGKNVRIVKGARGLKNGQKNYSFQYQKNTIYYISTNIKYVKIWISITFLQFALDNLRKVFGPRLRDLGRICEPPSKSSSPLVYVNASSLSTCIFDLIPFSR